MQSIRNLEFRQCRICYEATSNLQLLTSFAETGGSLVDEKTYAQLLLEVCNINVMNDKPLGRWPQFVCFGCSHKLILAYDFIQHTLKINKLLQSIADLLQSRSAFDVIEMPALDIPVEIKTEKDDELGSSSQERKFQYSPAEADFTSELTCWQTNEMFCNMPSSNHTSVEYKNNNNNKKNDKNNDDNMKEILSPSTVEFVSNDDIIKDDLEKFHRKFMNSVDDDTNENIDSDVEFVGDNLLCSTANNMFDSPVVSCNECNETFSNIWKLDKHKRFSHGAYYNKSYCTACSQKFSNCYNYRRHMRNVHGGKTKQLIKKKPQVIQNFNHTKQQLKQNKKPDVDTCNLCEKTFVSHAQLLRHLRYTHMSEEQKIACKFCDRKFARPDNYQGHMRRMHSGNDVAGNKPTTVFNSSSYRCSKCDCSYSRRNLLWKHQKDVHGNE